VIVVSLKEAADGLELRVRDDGAGLPKVADGQGIGMRLVRSLAQQCRGELEAGGAPGASFTIRMPRQGASRAGEAKSGPL
jgi:two-component sensor histidine kinase